MVDYEEGSKREVAELKFLIHDLRVERTINEIIHYHVTLDADLEIYNVEQAQALHSEDLQELRRQAISQRKAEKDYQNAVRSFSPDKTLVVLARHYIRKIREICDLILNPRWGRIDVVLSFLPDDCRSVQSRIHYRNLVRWVAGVHSRIEHFIEEMRTQTVNAEFEVASEVEDYVRNVVYGYLVEKSEARVEMHLEDLEHAVLYGNRYRFRRMFFNLVMNAANAMRDKKVGVIDVSTAIEGDRLVLRVKDSGEGMSPERIHQLMAERETLDGELHSLGFVFVRQTVAEFGGEIRIDSTPDVDTTVAVSLPYVKDAASNLPVSSEWVEYDALRDVDRVPVRSRTRSQGSAEALPPPVAPAPTPAPVAEATVPSPAPAHPADLDKQTHAGEMVYTDYRTCDAPFPGCIFGIAVTEKGRVEFFTHRPYEKYYNIGHEDLSPMFFEATVRGRLEEDDEKRPVLILKSPQNVREYFEFKEVPEDRRSAELYDRMVRDEYVRIARVLATTGLPQDIGVLLSDLERFFADRPELLENEPFPLGLLARQDVTSESGASA